MKFKLGPLENARTFYSLKGNTTVIRDTFTNQPPPPPQPELVKETEPEVEVKMSGEPTLEILAENPAPKTPKKKNERPTEN
jgi:hypothetical protein